MSRCRTRIKNSRTSTRQRRSQLADADRTQWRRPLCLYFHPFACIQHTNGDACMAARRRNSVWKTSLVRRTARVRNMFASIIFTVETTFDGRRPAAAAGNFERWCIAFGKRVEVRWALAPYLHAGLQDLAAMSCTVHGRSTCSTTVDVFQCLSSCLVFSLQCNVWTVVIDIVLCSRFSPCSSV